MVDFEWQLTEYLGQTSLDAAAAGLHLLDWIVAMDDDIHWKAENGTIQFEASRPFCTLQPEPTFIMCTILSGKQTRRITVANLHDITPQLCNQVNVAFQQSTQ